MPTLAEFANEYGDSVGFIGLLSDFEANRNGAVNIVNSADMPDNFFMINANDPTVAELVAAVQSGFFPTTAILTANDVFPDSITGKVNERHRSILDAVIKD
jgi:hypothetical protein